MANYHKSENGHILYKVENKTVTYVSNFKSSKQGIAGVEFLVSDEVASLSVNKFHVINEQEFNKNLLDVFERIGRVLRGQGVSLESMHGVIDSLNKK